MAGSASRDNPLGIVRLTRAPDIASYVEAIEGRIGALARVHSLLSKGQWEGAELGSIVAEELQPYRDKEGCRFEVSGPGVRLPPVIGQIFGLAFHELATNAAKHGALSSSAGKIKLAWDLEDKQLAIDWAESGGPAVRPPSVTGSGMRTILGAIEHQLNGKAEFDWQEQGLHCKLLIPRDERMIALEPTLKTRQSPSQVPFAPTPQLVSGNRLLLVEDEPLVALMMKEVLLELDFEVSGPVGSVDAALAEIAQGEVHGAVLDINLGGNTVYPVADALMAKGIPFIFLTGYSRQGVERRFSTIPVISKPVDREMLQACFARGSDIPITLAEGRIEAKLRQE
jgi:two-component sensor histidine kinase/CheY-like chemotaxis protein